MQNRYDGPIYMPVWVEPDGTEWHEDPVWECCEYGVEPFDPEKQLSEREREEFWKRIENGYETACCRPTKFQGDRGRIHIQLCGEHFEKVKRRSTVRWEEFCPDPLDWLLPEG